jgi:hypothetical protein
MTGQQRATETQTSAARSQKNTSNVKPPLPTSTSLQPVLQLQQTIGNQAVLRLLEPGMFQAKPGIGQEKLVQTKPAASAPLLHAHILQRKSVFKNCKGKEETLNSASDEAKKLAGRALSALKGERVEATEKEYLQTALRNNFGDVTDKQKTTIIERYANINDTLDSKEITCINKEKKEKKKTICAEAPVNSNEISLYLHFWRDGCGSKGEMMLHEAAHNAGAKDDIHKDEGYPPKSHAEDNAYSYQYFAVDVQKGPPRVRYGGPKGQEK